MKTLKIMLICLCIIAILVPIVITGISIHMQGYYKAQIDGTLTKEETDELLQKKKFWANVNESYVYGVCGYSVLAVSLVTLVFIRKYS